MSGLRSIYSDICHGYSRAKWYGKDVYIKHLNHHDQVEIDEVYDRAFESARKRKIRTEKEQVAWLKEKGLWLPKDEIALSQQKMYLDNLKKTRDNLMLKSLLDQNQKAINEAKEDYLKLVFKKKELIGLTAEQIAHQKTQFEYIRIGFYKDTGLTARVFSPEDINDMDDRDSEEIMSIFEDNLKDFDPNSLRKISVSSFFTNHFYLVGDNLYSFFGKPLCDLTIYQVHLLSYGAYFKNIMTNNQIPENLRENPDKLEEYVKRGAARDKMLEKVGSGRVGIVGATQEDFDALNLKNDGEFVNNLAKKEYKDAKKVANDLRY